MRRVPVGNTLDGPERGLEAGFAQVAAAVVVVVAEAGAGAGGEVAVVLVVVVVPGYQARIGCRVC